MLKQIAINSIFRGALLICILALLVFVLIFGKNSAKAEEFNRYSGNVGVASTAPSDNIPPSVFITNPLNGSTVSGVVSYAANASDNVGVTNVAFYVDQGLVGTDNSAPYSTLWDTTVYAHNTTHSLITLAFDAAGNVGTSQSYSVTVLDITPPTVSITNPQNGAIVPRRSIVTITANAADVSGVIKVEFRVNGSLKCLDTTSPYSCNWNVPIWKNRTYNIEAKAFDILNQTATHTITVTSSN